MVKDQSRFSFTSIYALAVSFSLSLFFSSCTPDLKAPKPQAGSADFRNTIALGGDFMAGYQDGALYLDGQKHCIPALMAQQFTLAGGAPFRQALMPDNKGLGLNSKPWKSAFVSASHLGNKADCKGVISLQPLFDSLPVTQAYPYLAGTSGNGIQNLAVPQAITSQLFSVAFGASFYAGNKNPFYNRIAGNAGSSTVYTDARNLNPTFFSAWLGMEDIYEYARNGGYRKTIAPSAVFASYLDTLLGTLTRNGAKGVIATIPDFRVFPFYTLVPYNGAALNQNKADSLNTLYASALITNIHFVAGNNAFVIQDSSVSTLYRQLTSGEYITLDVPLDSMKCNFLGLIGSTMPNRYVLTAAEVALIDQRTAAYNAVIAQKASQYGLALADMNAYFKTVHTGLLWDGVNYNGQFVTGGFFSLDGYHPNQKGYALLANEFIRVINLKYGSTIPQVNCPDCNGVLFP